MTEPADKFLFHNYILQGLHLCQLCCVLCTYVVDLERLSSKLPCSSVRRALLKCRVSWVQFPPGGIFFLFGPSIFWVLWIVWYPLLLVLWHTHISKPWSVYTYRQSVCLCVYGWKWHQRHGSMVCVFLVTELPNCSCDHHTKCSILSVFVIHVEKLCSSVFEAFGRKSFEKLAIWRNVCEYIFFCIRPTCIVVVLGNSPHKFLSCCQLWCTCVCCAEDSNPYQLSCPGSSVGRALT
jgi:hypothetical protein